MELKLHESLTELHEHCISTWKLKFNFWYAIEKKIGNGWKFDFGCYWKLKLLSQIVIASHISSQTQPSPSYLGIPSNVFAPHPHPFTLSTPLFMPVRALAHKYSFYVNIIHVALSGTHYPSQPLTCMPLLGHCNLQITLSTHILSEKWHKSGQRS